MDKKEKLISEYLESAKKTFFYTSMEQYVDERLKKYLNFCTDKAQEEQIMVWIKLLHEDNGKNIVYLGLYLSLKENNMEYLNNALNSAAIWGRITMTNSGFDHCIYAWNVLPTILCANRFQDIEKIFPRENGFSRNGMKLLCTITNLVMCLYYQEAAWKEQVLKESERTTKAKLTLEEKAVINCLIALVKKDWERFSAELENVYKGHKKTREYGETTFTRSVSFFALGLYNFSRYLYGDEADHITLPKDDILCTEFHNYQKSIGYQTGSQFYKFEQPLLLLNDLENIDLPVMCLTGDKPPYLDIERYRGEIIEKVMNI